MMGIAWRHMCGLDPEARVLLERARLAGSGAIHEQGVDLARRLHREGRRALPPGPFADTMDITVPGPAGSIPVRRYRPAEVNPAGRVIYAHGGGWVLGGIDESEAVCRTLAARSRCEVLSVDYRMAPEHRFPAAVDDLDAVVRAIDDAGPLALVGDSAGGNLAAVAARRARDRGDDRVVLQVLVYPVTDHRMDTASYAEHGSGYLLTREDMAWFWDLYVPEPVKRAVPDAAPLLADNLAGVAPALVLVAGHDVLRDEALHYADRLRGAGVKVTVVTYDGMMHGFFPLVGALSAADHAVYSVSAAVASALERPSENPS
jgi:acetyl esterase